MLSLPMCPNTANSETASVIFFRKVYTICTSFLLRSYSPGRCTRLSRQFTGLGTMIEKMAGKRTTVKKLKTPVRSKIEEAPQIVVFEHP